MKLIKKVIIFILCFLIVFAISFYLCSFILQKQQNANAADFRYAMVFSPTGEIIKEGYVDDAIRYTSSDTMMVTIDDETYTTHSSNIIIINRKDLVVNKEASE